MKTPSPVSLEDLPGLGPRSAEWLREVGIQTADELRASGPAVAFLRVAQSGRRPSRNLLWALHGALENKPWIEVTQQEKDRLERELARLTGE